MFNFENAEVSKGNYKETIKPGISVVKTTGIITGVSSQKQTPYLEFTVEDSHGAELKQQYYLSTVVNPGKQKSAWDISKNAILALVAASNNLDEATAKTKMPNAKSAEELAQKLAILLTGKEFRLKITGEEKISQKGTKYVASSFGNGVFCESKSVSEAESKLFFSADKNVKKLAIEPANTTDAQSAFSSPAADSVTF
jgi:hypothetical protein